MRSLRALAVTVVVGRVGLASVGLALADDGKSAESNAGNSRASRFVGYWMGIDPRRRWRLPARPHAKPRQDDLDGRARLVPLTV
jgi:hypothetical protein